MASTQLISPNSEVAQKHTALSVNTNAAISLREIMKSNLGPRGTLKMFCLLYNFFYVENNYFEKG